MGRFYRKFYAGRRSPLLDAAIYLGIGAKLAGALAVSAAQRLGGRG
jgi:hypothetical protein